MIILSAIPNTFKFLIRIFYIFLVQYITCVDDYVCEYVNVNENEPKILFKQKNVLLNQNLSPLCKCDIKKNIQIINTNRKYRKNLFYVTNYQLNFH